jgi:hypothetical protein
MIIFAASDKGGTGRSVTSSNLLYRKALQGSDVCYLDFDFGSPTAGAIFNINAAARGTRDDNGLHNYLLRGTPERPVRLDVWRDTDGAAVRSRPAGAGRLVLAPGDVGGGEFASTPQIVQRCTDLLIELDGEFDLVLVDLSAGRSYATQIVLQATGHPAMQHAVSRWLIFHRWTRQHIIAANGLVYGDGGILKSPAARAHDPERLRNSIRFVRTAYVHPDSDALAGLGPEQIAWLRGCNRDLLTLASSLKVGRTATLGTVPLDPVLQWREQLITDSDTNKKIANHATVEAFEDIARRLTEEESWVPL